MNTTPIRFVPLVLATSLMTWGCGGPAPDDGADAPAGASEAAGEASGQDPAQVAEARTAATQAREAAEAANMAGVILATVNGEPQEWYIPEGNDLNDWKPEEDGSTRVELIGSPVKDDFEWTGSMELTFNLTGSDDALTVTNPQIIYHSKGATDFHRTTSGRIVVSDASMDGDRLTVAGSFSGTLAYQSFSKEPLDGLPEQMDAEAGAFHVVVSR